MRVKLAVAELAGVDRSHEINRAHREGLLPHRTSCRAGETRVTGEVRRPGLGNEFRREDALGAETACSRAYLDDRLSGVGRICDVKKTTAAPDRDFPHTLA
ncbi:hypothetical protein GCM10023094_45430 [Rhodococcus olei]|uniref:Uncharacterized protein n=1 Tax=Rhodococcus olei TaxID=2161675 RepID=A0ABP8PIX2_9NOCA